MEKTREMVHAELDAFYHRVIEALGPFDTHSAIGWQLVWDNHPELRREETRLLIELNHAA